MYTSALKIYQSDSPQSSWEMLAFLNSALVYKGLIKGAGNWPSLHMATHRLLISWDESNCVPLLPHQWASFLLI